MPEVSVVIPAYNEEKLIERCLKSLVKQDFPRRQYEIIVVDNGSTDKTASLAKKYADKVVYEPKKGLMYARKRGFDEAQGEIILRTDADAYVPYNWISRAVRIFRDYPDADAITGWYFIDKKDAHFSNAWSRIQIKVKDISFQLRGTIFWLSGSCSGFMKAFYHKIGGFNDKLDPVLADQVEIAYRANEYGKVYYDPTWNITMSGRRSEIKSIRRIPDWLNDYLIYQGINLFLFWLFRKQIFRIFGRGWKDIREE